MQLNRLALVCAVRRDVAEDTRLRPARAVTTVGELARLAELRASNALASAHFSAGRDNEAEEILKQLLPECRRKLGESHVDTLVVAGNLAVCRVRLRGDTADLDTLEAHVRDRVRVLGPGHPMSLTATEALAVAMRAAGRLDAAEALGTEVVRIRVVTLGAEHPATLQSRLSLALVSVERADLYIAAGELEAIDDDAPTGWAQARAVAVVALGHLAQCYAELGYDAMARGVARRAAAEHRGLGEHRGPVEPSTSAPWS